jgi:antitoxin (DNA-binding transcriptional repressor) of toxin-antitoxin stability system
MTIIRASEFQKDPTGFLRRAQGGEELLIVEGERPIAEIRPAPQPQLQPRPFGLCAGEFRVPDDFNAPLPDEIVSDFEGR